jgi:hypothetical protein
MDDENFEDPQEPTKGGSRRKFTPDEDLQIRSLVERLGTQSWEEIAKFLPERSARQCRDRYKNYLVESLVMNPWTSEEDAIVVEKYHQIGPKWVEIGKLLSGRSGNNVKNRWHKHLVKLDIGARPSASAAPQIPPKPKDSLNPTEEMGTDAWQQWFGNGESAMQFASSWSSGFSVGDPLF